MAHNICILMVHVFIVAVFVVAVLQFYCVSVLSISHDSCVVGIVLLCNMNVQYSYVRCEPVFDIYSYGACFFLILYGNI